MTLTDSWERIDGINNASDDNDNIVAKLNGTTVYVAYCAFGDVKIIELANVTDACIFESTNMTEDEIYAAVEDNWELAIPVIIEGKHILITVGEPDDTITIIGGVEVGVKPSVESSSIYDCDELEMLEDQYPEYEGVRDALQIS